MTTNFARIILWIHWILLFVFNPTESLRQCGNTTTFCPDSGECCNAQYSPTKYGCRLGYDSFSLRDDNLGYLPHYSDFDESAEIMWPPSPTSSCCMPGPQYPPSATLANCLIIGDSVSIGYNGVAAQNVSDVCKLQHGPWDVSDGGAGATSVGVACLDNFLRTQGQQDVRWDVILFNFGLHDLDNSTSAEATYRSQLTNITSRLVETGAKLLYATTTPFMPKSLNGSTVVDDLNAIAREVIAAHDVTVVDLHKTVTDHCGVLYEDCDWCRVHPCSYHYNPEGETAQGLVVADAFRKALSG